MLSFSITTMSRRIFIAIFVVLSVISLANCCYDECIQTFSAEMDKISQSTNSSSLLTEDFCRAMSSQVKCLDAAQIKCQPQQQALIQSLLTVFIQPDYQRTCSGQNATSDNKHITDSTTSITGIMRTSYTGTNPLGHPIPSWGGTGFTGIIPTTGRTLIICRQKIQYCQINFNQTFTANMALFNISGLCQSLKQYTICFINLLSSECGHLVPNSLVYNMQQHYGGMCSNDAQANTQTMIECANLTMKCFTQLNSSFLPAAGDYNLKIMCSAIDNYTVCMQNVSYTDECTPFITQSLKDIAQLKSRHNAYCGDDNGQTATQCVQSFQDCFSPFNKTFFPALHRANLTQICSSLSTYASCVSRFTPTCGQQFGQVLKSVQTLKIQFGQRCHPNIIKIASCRQVGQCSQVFMKTFSQGRSSSSELCRNIADYFPCVERGLGICKVPQYTTEIGFGGIGVLMKEYCDKLSSNMNLVRCSSFSKCTTAIWLSFSPSIQNLYEGSTWCTFLQLSIGCAEHAFQSSSCPFDGDLELQQKIQDLDQLRVQTCERGKEDRSDVENFVDHGHQEVDSANRNSASVKNLSVSAFSFLTGLVLCLAAVIFHPETLI